MVPDLIALGSIGRFVKGRGLAKADLTDEGIPCLRYAEIYTKYGDVTRTLVSRTSDAGARASQVLKHGDIVFAASGETAEEIGKVVAYLGPGPAAVGGDTIILTEHRQDSAFLAHALNSEHAAKQKAALGKGHSVVHIHAPDLAKLMLWVPPLPQQRRIAAVLDAWDAAIATAERLVEAKRRELAAYAQKVLLEENRATVRLAEIAVINPPAHPVHVMQPVTFLTMEDVSVTGQINRRTERLKSDLGPGFTAFAENDTLVAKITPCFENGKGAFANGLAGGLGLGSTEFHVLRAKGPTNPRFLFHHTRTSRFRQAGESMMSGSAGQKRVPKEFLEDYRLPVLDVDEQALAVSLLDAAVRSSETVDGLIAALRQQKRGLMQLLLTGKLRVPESIDALLPPGLAHQATIA